jgi:hypothetical protein
VPGLGAVGLNYTQGSYITGFVFRANRAISITQFGYYDSNLTGGVETFQPHAVGVYDLSTHTLVGSTTVQPSDPVTGLFHYVSLPNPIAVNTTDTYAIVGVTGTNNYTVGITAREAPVNAALTYVSGAGYGPSNNNATKTSTLVEPNAFDAGNIFGQPTPAGTLCDFGPNFMFVASSGGSDAGVDAPFTSPGDAAAGSDGSGGRADGAIGSDGSTTGVDAGVTSSRDVATSNDGTGGGCLSPMTTFPRIAQGDSSPNWTSGVGAITANDLFIFYGWSGSNPGEADGGLGKYGAIYVQSFDPRTSASRGPAHVLFNTPAGTFGSVPIISGTATAPSGQIVILYSVSVDTYGQGSGLFAAFFDPSADAGAPTIVPLDPNPNPQMLRYVIWSNARNAFALTWVSSSMVNTLKVENFSPEGLAVGGNTNVVPTNGVSNSVSDYNSFQGGIAESGNILGVAYADHKTYYPFLTVLDRVGNPVGSPLQVGTYLTNWNAIAGTPKGFVYFYANSYDLKEVFLPTSGDAIVVDATPDARSFSQTSVNLGSGKAWVGSACMDSVGPNATGGVGVVALYNGGPVFAYLNPDGTQPQSSTQVVAHSLATYDTLSVTSFNGRFLVSLWSNVAMSTQIFANGCP